MSLRDGRPAAPDADASPATAPEGGGPCPDPGAEFLRGLNRRAVAERIPLSGSLELTARCNLLCRHCYLPETARKGEGGPPAELGTDEWVRILDQAVDAGCLFALLTGGEPLIRTDFRRLYVHARSRGLLTEVFTNGTLVDPELVGLFRDYPPRLIEVSLYAATAETYGRITGSRSAFRQCLRGVELLREAGIRVALKTMLLDLNEREYLEMASLARRWGLPFRMDPLLFARLDGNRTPLSHRVAPERVAELEMTDPDRREAWLRHGGRPADALGSDRLYTCGAGSTGFFVRADGILQGCLMAREVSYDLRTGPLEEGWRRLTRLRDLRAPPGYRCPTCATRALCGFCAPIASVEGAANCPSEYACRLGEARYHGLLSMRGGG